MNFLYSHQNRHNTILTLKHLGWKSGHLFQLVRAGLDDLVIDYVMGNILKYISCKTRPFIVWKIDGFLEKNDSQERKSFYRKKFLPLPYFILILYVEFY